MKGLNGFERVVSVVAFAMLIVGWVFVIICYPKLPEIIPSHFNFSGDPDEFSAKRTIFILPVVGTLVFVIMTILMRLPLQRDVNMFRTFLFLRTIIITLFTLISFFTFLSATGRMSGLGKWFVPVTLVLVLLPTSLLIRSAFKAAAKN